MTSVIHATFNALRIPYLVCNGRATIICDGVQNNLSVDVLVTIR